MLLLRASHCPRTGAWLLLFLRPSFPSLRCLLMKNAGWSRPPLRSHRISRVSAVQHLQSVWTRESGAPEKCRAGNTRKRAQSPSRLIQQKILQPEPSAGNAGHSAPLHHHRSGKVAVVPRQTSDVARGNAVGGAAPRRERTPGWSSRPWEMSSQAVEFETGARVWSRHCPAPLCRGPAPPPGPRQSHG
jgi:hypothetical protein